MAGDQLDPIPHLQIVPRQSKSAVLLAHVHRRAGQRRALGIALIHPDALDACICHHQIRPGADDSGQYGEGVFKPQPQLLGCSV